MFRMKRHESAPAGMRRNRSRWARLLLAAMLILGLGMAQAVEPKKKPVLTRSGMKAALTQAAKPILQPSMAKMAAAEVDQTTIPHYFGPFPNWANSPFTLPDVAVTIDGDGTGATAAATVWANGAVTGINVTNPGHGYTWATVTISASSSTGTGSGAAAEAAVNTSGVVTAVNVDIGGTGYVSPVVAIWGGGATTDATATAYGGVDAVELTAPGGGYTFPTVDFDLPDGPDGVPARAHADFDPGTGAITAIVVDQPGSGYSTAPEVVIRDGTLFDPINNGGYGAMATATLIVQSVGLYTFGSGYTSVPSVDIADSEGDGAGASATAVTDFGAVTAIAVTSPGSGYITGGGIKKFRDTLPLLGDPSVAGSCDEAMNNLGQYIPLAVPDTTTFTTSNGFKDDADFYVIALVQHRERMSSSLPELGTLLRGYVQLETPANASWSKHVALQNDLVDGTSVPALLPDGNQAIAVDDPHFLGPIIAATKNKPVRIVFYNLLPTGAGGNLFLPVDSSLMGSGMGPMDMMMPPADEGTVTDMIRDCACSMAMKDENANCFKDNRATLHLHGGASPWISDGTVHQWITPANENTPWPQGVDVSEVPDMANVPGVPNCTGATDGCMTFYYTNQQSARLMFYHDHSWGITRLNVYAGEAAGYLIADPTEQKLFGPEGLFPELGTGIPLVIQDRTFVPPAAQLAEQDPTWDESRWGGYGNLWYHHVYMPAQNPSDPSGMSAYGRWMYGPWFWPPYMPPYGPIANPYYNMDPKADPPFSQPLATPCNLDDPATWQYQVPPFCEPPQIPGTPNISVGMEQFNDTPIVNGTAYPTITLEPKSYRMRILNAANDRFWNLQWYVADPRTGTDSEVALNPAEVAAAQLDPNVVPTPDTSNSPPGPDWIQIGSEGGFLPAPAVIPNQPTTWITDPTRFDVGNVDKHSLLLACAERADVIVDFSRYAGKTLILYNDAPAAFPARVAGYDYYTGHPDLSPAGAPTTLPGYGPNTRTIMQVKIAGSPDDAFDLSALNNAFRHHADGSGVFESGQHPIIVGQAAYNSAYGTTFASGSWCNDPANPSCVTCDGFARISEQGGDLFGFNTLKSPNTKLSIRIEPKALHDEMNSTSFDEYGRMQATLGIEAVPATPAAQNVTLFPFVNPPTEIFDATNLPRNDIDVAPISMADGTQIWKITHNGVDTHPIHFHLFDVQVLNRVTWDNIILAPDANELGWKETVRVSPLEDTLLALRPVIPTFPFELPNAIRPLNPMMPLGDTSMFNNISPQGIPTNPIVNQLVNFGWEYMYHCHILSHEEMDMMRPVLVAVPPNRPDGLAYVIDGNAPGASLALTWNDNSITETAFVVQGAVAGGGWENLAVVPSPLDQANTHGVRTFTDTDYPADLMVQFRVVAENAVGYGAEFPSVTVQSVSDPIVIEVPSAPANLTATVAKVGTAKAQSGSRVSLTWTDTAVNETAFTIERSTGEGTEIIAVPADTNTYVDTPTVAGTYHYRVAALNASGISAYSNTVSVTVSGSPAGEGEGEDEDESPFGCFGGRPACPSMAR
jgi:FtsP/CotA-like multicopper oxidase with cupredoxin domain